METYEIKKGIYWVGALDKNLRVFDIIMFTPYGTSYNSYVVKGTNKTAIFETVKENFFDDYIKKINDLGIDLEKVDYIVVDHTEPDHAGSIAKLLSLAKNAKVVGSAAAIKFVKAIANTDFESIIVNDGDQIDLGDKTLSFISAPLLHWPDSMFTYIKEDNVLITCDAFGCHYADEGIFDDKIKNYKDYEMALKYYFDCIMGPFKPAVLKAVNKIENLKIDTILSGHGPVLRKDPMRIVSLYKKWSKKDVHLKPQIVIIYVTAYGYTEAIAKKIEEGIKSKLDADVCLFNAVDYKTDELIEKVNNSDGILFGSPTINGAALTPILNLISAMNPIVHSNKTTAAFGSYGWSGEAVPFMTSMLKNLRTNVLEPGLKINFKPSNDELKQCFEFGKSFAEKLIKKLKK